MTSAALVANLQLAHHNLCDQQHSAASILSLSTNPPFPADNSSTTTLQSSSAAANTTLRSIGSVISPSTARTAATLESRDSRSTRPQLLPRTASCSASQNHNIQAADPAAVINNPSASSTSLPIPTIIVGRPSTSTTDKVDSKPRTGVLSVTSRAQSRLAALGRSTLRGIVPIGDHFAQGEALPARPPVSPSDVSSQYKRSDGSSNSKSSSETSLSDDGKPYLQRFEGNPEGWQERELHTYQDFEEYEKILRRSPRMMHQTSSKLLRMTEDDRPFTRDFKDLFSTLMVSLPLTGHRVRLSRVEHTFTTEEAITNLGSLKFSQSNRMPDPKDSSRIVTTTTTTTFSMAKEMARSVCMRFLEARFIESLEGKSDFNTRGSVWQLTPKGMHILARFCQRNGIHQRHVNDLLDSPRNIMNLVILERESETDKLDRDRATVDVIFRRFAGNSPNVRTSVATNDSDSVLEYSTGLAGVRMQRLRRGDKESPYVFSGKTAFDWIMNCCTVVDKREVFEIANLFLQHGLVEPAADDRHANHVPLSTRFAASKHMLYSLTDKGERTAGWNPLPNGVVSNGDAAQRTGILRDSNTNRMTVILHDSALRLLFREYLQETHCEENLSFFVEVKTFLSEYERAKQTVPAPKSDTIRETLASAYSLYNAYLAPGSPCELNIDHNLRNALAGRMTRAVGEDDQMVKSLDEVALLFEQALNSVFKLMASDSVPKFSREPRYAHILRERNIESNIA